MLKPISGNLKTKYDLYTDLIKQEQDSHGFIDSNHCDSLLFSGLTACSTNININIKAAYDSDTMMWHRRPTERPCYTCGDETDPKGSTISRDMLVGLLWYAYAHKRLDIVNTVIERAFKNWGFMGCAGSFVVWITKCQIMPPLFVTALLVRSYILGGRWYDRFLKKVPANMGGTPTGYQAHLQVIHILLRKLSAGISEKEEALLLRQADRQPNNAVFQLAVGKFKEAEEILSRDNLFPSTRLPTPKDRKEFWIWQRDFDENGNWDPANRSGTHAGGDYIFAYWLMNHLKGSYSPQ